MLKTEVNELRALNQEMWLLHMYRDHLDQTNDKLEQDETRLEFELKEIWEWDTGNERTVRDRIADLQFAIEQEDERLEVLYRDHDRMEQRNLEIDDQRRLIAFTYSEWRQFAFVDVWSADLSPYACSQWSHLVLFITIVQSQ